MEEDIYIIKLGNHIRQLRIKKGISQKQLADDVDIEAPNLRRIEIGKTNPTTRTLFRIAKALDITMIDLFKFP